MKNDIYSDIGRRIKKKRTEAGLTQAALCGDRITRNMLSRIETGDAHPSLDTLLYLADKLKTPASYFLCRSIDEESQYDKAVLCAELRGFIDDERYDRAASVAFDSSDDEVLFAKAVSEAHCAFSELEKFNFSTAQKHIKAAERAAGETVYTKGTILSEIAFIKTLIINIRDGGLPQASAVAQASAAIIGAETHTYLLALAMYSECGAGLCLASLLKKNSHMRKYLEIKKLIDVKNYSEALTGLCSILSENASALVTVPAMKDAELCYYETGQYKEAYETAKRREDILNKD